MKPASDTDKADFSSYNALDKRDIRSILFGVMLEMFLSSLDQTIIATALPTIGRDLGDFEHLSWIVTIYLLTSTAVTPLYGKFSDAHGRRVTMLIALTTFIIGSIASAMATSMFHPDRGPRHTGARRRRSDRHSPDDHRRHGAAERTFPLSGYFATVFAISSLLGPVLGGFFADHLHWSMIFWINVLLGAIAFLITNNRLRKLPRNDRKRSLDLIGSFLMATATVLLLLALNWGGMRFAWTSPEIIGLIGLSAFLWLAFAFRLKMAQEPLIPPDVLNNAVVRMGVLSASCGVGTYIGLTIYLPVYFETARGLSASSSGLALIPLMIGSVLGATISGRTHYKRFALIGLAMSMAGALILAIFVPRSASVVSSADARFHIGRARYVVPGFDSLHPEYSAPAPARHCNRNRHFFRSLGGALIVALFGAIVLSGVDLTGGASLETLSGSLSRNSNQVAGVFSYVFGAAFVGFALAFGFLFAMEERPLRGRTEVAPRRSEG